MTAMPIRPGILDSREGMHEGLVIGFVGEWNALLVVARMADGEMNG